MICLNGHDSLQGPSAAERELQVVKGELQELKQQLDEGKMQLRFQHKCDTPFGQPSIAFQLPCDAPAAAAPRHMQYCASSAQAQCHLARHVLRTCQLAARMRKPKLEHAVSQPLKQKQKRQRLQTDFSIDTWALCRWVFAEPRL